MTQLFDTHDFETESTDPAETPARHLRSLPTWDPSAELADRTSEWRLDADTIEIGRRGIARARQALQEAAGRGDRSSSKPHRRAA